MRKVLWVVVAVCSLGQSALAQELSFDITGEDAWRGAFEGYLEIVGGQGDVKVTREVTFTADGSTERLSGKGERRGNRVHADLERHRGAIGRLEQLDYPEPVKLVFEANGERTRCRAYSQVKGKTFSRSTGKANDGVGEVPGVGAVPISGGPKVSGQRCYQGCAFIEGEGDGRKVHPSDCRQGRLADCYLVAAMIAVARTDPDVIEDMITDNGDGSYDVKLIDVGWFNRDKTVRVDKVFPHSDCVGKGPAYCKFGDELQREDGSTHHELWPALIEKAYAKHKGGFGKIQYGPSTAVFSFMTGKPTEALNLSKMSDAQIRRTLSEALRNGNPVTVGSKKGIREKKKARTTGVVGNHAYVVWSEEGGGFRLYNPWKTDHPPQPLSPAELRALFHTIYVGRF